MGEDCRESKIGWLPLVSYGRSFLRFLMKEYGYIIDGGDVWVADNDVDARRFVAEYCSKTRGNGVKITNLRRYDLYNFQCGFLHFRKGIKEEQAITFLENDKFLPVILVGGLLPECLRTNKYIFRLKSEDVAEVCKKEFGVKISRFYSYITDNVKDVCEVLEKIGESAELLEHDGSEDEKKTFAIFLAVGKIYCKYLQKNFSEQQADEFLQNYIQETRRELRKIKEFSCGEELEERISDLIWGFLERNPQILLCDAEAIDEQVYEALKSGTAILYNDHYYFLPPHLFMEICEPLLQTASEPEVKRNLKEVGILHCNSADYSVKKDIVNVFGAKERIRMFWLCKEMLEFPDNLRLEDAFANESTNTWEVE